MRAYYGKKHAIEAWIAKKAEASRKAKIAAYYASKNAQAAAA